MESNPATIAKYATGRSTINHLFKKNPLVNQCYKLKELCLQQQFLPGHLPTVSHNYQILCFPSSVKPIFLGLLPSGPSHYAVHIRLNTHITVFFGQQSKIGPISLHKYICLGSKNKLNL